MEDTPIFKPKSAEPPVCRSADYLPQETINNNDMKLGAHAQLELGMEILNLTTVSITVTTRFGERYVLAPRNDGPHFQGEGIYFTIRRKATDEVKVLKPYRTGSDTASVANRARNGLMPEDRPLIRSRGNTRQVKMACGLTMKELRAAGGRVYMEDLDVMISLSESSVIDYHPFSKEAIEDYMALRWSDETSCDFRIYVVDNDMRTPTWFMNLNGMIFRVPAICRNGVPNGVYVVHPPEASVGRDPQCRLRYEAQWVSWEDAQTKYNLYPSIAEAETFGFTKDSLARENMQNKRVEDQARLLFNDEERRFKLESAERDRAWERERWEHEQQARREEAAAAREKAECAFRDKLEDDRRRREKQQREDEEWAREVEMTRVKSTKELFVVVAGFATTILTMVVTLIKVTKGK